MEHLQETGVRVKWGGGRKMRKRTNGFLLAFPALAGFLVFYFVPFLITVWYWRRTERLAEYVGGILGAVYSVLLAVHRVLCFDLFCQTTDDTKRIL